MQTGSNQQLWIFLFIFGGIFLAFGFLSGPGFVHIQSEIKRMQQWPLADATIVKADITTTLSGAGAAHYLEYMHRYTYNYSINGASYTNDRQFYGDPPEMWMSESMARSQLSPPGAKIKIHYNPEQPADSVIRVQAPTVADDNLTRAVSLIVTVISGLFTMVCAVILLKRRWAGRQAISL